jgi:rhodanese-related sulfurtransferase
MDDRPTRAAPQSSGIYHSLWPLQVMGLLDRRGCPTAAWRIPEDVVRPSRVAIIDTSVAVAHPNLRAGINRRLALDLVSTRLGAFPYAPEGACGPEEMPDVAIVHRMGSPGIQRLLGEFSHRLASGRALVEGILPAVDPAFACHGTAIAGLVGGRPARLESIEAADGSLTDVVLPFAGADPFCELVPISTGFDPDPEQMILALAYAEIIDADVVLIPRDFSDPMRTVPALACGDGIWPGYPVELSEDERLLWNDLAEFVVSVSMRRPIVCAAGNSGDGNIIYPACLAAPGNGIVAVAAVNADGRIAGYSSRGTAITLAAPSNDGERFDRDEVRLDHRDPETPDRWIPGLGLRVPFSTLDVISTDVPGNFGYNTSVYGDRSPNLDLDPEADAQPRSVREVGSFYCRFGGTSAAAALAAGFASLAVSRGDLARGVGGVAAKNWLLERVQCVEGLDYPVLSWDATLNLPAITYALGEGGLGSPAVEKAAEDMATVPVA